MQPRLLAEGVATRLEGPLLFLRRTLDVGLGEAVEVRGGDGSSRLGRVAAADRDTLTIEVLESTSGLALGDTVVRFLGEPLSFELGPGILGRVFDGVGQVIDGGPPVPARDKLRIDGLPFNPVARATPRDFIETGITALDLMNSLVRGQKLPIFSGGGLPHDRIAVDIATNARLPKADAGEFAIVFAGIGLPHDSAEYFRRRLEEGGALERTALFLNLASDSSTQRLLTPRYALTAAEYLAFVEGKHVLVILTDMTNYCEALREVSGRFGELPGEGGYPAYLSSRLADFYERAARVETLGGDTGSVTVMGAISPPSGDFSEPVTSHTKRFVKSYWALDVKRAQARFYPALHPLQSYAEDAGDFAPWWSEQGNTQWLELRRRFLTLLDEQARLERMARIIGKDALPPRQQLTLLAAEIVNDAFLRQSAFAPKDRAASPAKQAAMMRLVARFIELAGDAVAAGVAPDSLAHLACVRPLVRMGEEIGNDELPRFAQLGEAIEAQFHDLARGKVA
jgi:V/A-type H+-transporting ATPase subunit B